MGPGSKAWIGLTAYVTGYDLWAAIRGEETLSTAFYRALRHPVKRFPLILLWAYLTAHLFHLLPERYDPLRQAGRLFQRTEGTATCSSCCG